VDRDQKRIACLFMRLTHADHFCSVMESLTGSTIGINKEVTLRKFSCLTKEVKIGDEEVREPGLCAFAERKLRRRRTMTLRKKQFLRRKTAFNGSKSYFVYHNPHDIYSSATTDTFLNEVFDVPMKMCISIHI